MYVQLIFWAVRKFEVLSSLFQINERNDWVCVDGRVKREGLERMKIYCIRTGSI